MLLNHSPFSTRTLPIVMEHNLFLHQFIHPLPPSQPKPRPRPASQMSMDHFDFEFPTAISGPGKNPALPNDIVFCGKIISRLTDPSPPQRVRNPFLLRSESFGKINSGRRNGLIASLQSLSTGKNRLQMSSQSRKHYNGLFGVLKFPLQMELSDIKMRQGRREPASLPRLPVSGDGETKTGGGRKNRWDLVRRLRRRGRQ